ncbi:DUF4290 domain-containing protein [Fibrella sp. HMF5335]|uniref:DUF4290 domain-containing protein n=1 Tax=Fibrella rubiginis TaxID=2817060 RepID=A0A939GKJ7_9BACT|nr:DUF4290 domain-containing protein [Fibrella rubiginis]MBO0939553.1 DUF4290 domain-containing protein [Fibrella rubiginis]
MKEYGSSIQKMVNYLLTIEDRTTRTRQAHILVELMRQLHPAMKDGQDYYNKLWDDLYIMSGFKLDVDSPYPPPSPDVLGKKPQKVGYQYHNLKYKHFGQNINLLIDRAFNTEDADERRGFVSYLVRLMRTFYTAWNKENVEDETIYQSILDISKGKLAPDIALIRSEGLVESSPIERADEQPQRITAQKNNRFSNNYGQQRNRQDRNNGGGNNNRSQFRGGNNANNNNRNPFRGGGNNPGNGGGNNRRRGR